MSKWPAIYAIGYISLVAFLGGLKFLHFLLPALFVVPYYIGGRLRDFAWMVLPFVLTLQVYNSMSYYNDIIRAEINVANIYHFEKNWFGINTEAGRQTLNEFFETRTHWTLDVLTAVVYLVFGVVYLIQGLLYRFRWAKTESEIRLALAYMWGFFFVNVLGYSTYYWFPAAPPWYVMEYGLGPADLSAPPSAAGLLRFDALIGQPIFADIYGTANTVFGAIPSLHCTYPFLAMLFCFSFRKMQVFAVVYCALMFFSSVYLNHHYLIDGLWGAGYAILVYVIALQILKRKMA